MNLEPIYRLENNIWKRVRMKQLRIGDLFKMHNRQYKTLDNPKFIDGVWSIESLKI